MSGATRTRPGLEWTDLAPWRPYDGESVISRRVPLVRIEVDGVAWVSDRCLAVRLQDLPEGGPDLTQYYEPLIGEGAQRRFTHSLEIARAGTQPGHTAALPLLYLLLADRVGWTWTPCGIGRESRWAAWQGDTLIAVAAMSYGRLRPGDDYTREQAVYRVLEPWIDSALHRGLVAEQIVDELTAIDTPTEPIWRTP